MKNNVNSIFICIPVYNEEKRIQYLIKSLYKSLEKISVKFEIWIVVNGSTDSTFEIINSIKKKYYNLKNIKIKKKGKTNAINEIIKRNLNKDVGIFIDGDCIVDKDSMKNIIYYLNSNPNKLAITGMPHPIVEKTIKNYILNIRMIYQDVEISKNIVGKNYEKPFIHGRIFALRKEVFFELVKSNFKKSKGDDTYLSHFLIYNYGRESFSKLNNVRVYYTPVSSIKGWWKKWLRIWSDLEELYELEPKFKDVKNYMETRYEWKNVRKKGYKVYFYFICEFIMRKSAYIIFKLRSRKYRGIWERLDETKSGSF